MNGALAGVSRPRILKLYDDLMGRYGPQGWWPGDDAFEVAIGAVLVQRTAWTNARRALENLERAGLGDPASMRKCEVSELERHVRPAGFFRQKARRLIALCAWIEDEGGFESLGSLETDELRRRLLAVTGIGHETADCILLYAFGRPAFIADAYARRLFHRLGWTGRLAVSDYEALRQRVEARIDPDPVFFNELHALIVRHGKTFCAAAPACGECGIRSSCLTGSALRAGRRSCGR